MLQNQDASALQADSMHVMAARRYADQLHICWSWKTHVERYSTFTKPGGSQLLPELTITPPGGQVDVTCSLPLRFWFQHRLAAIYLRFFIAEAELGSSAWCAVPWPYS